MAENFVLLLVILAIIYLVCERAFFTRYEKKHGKPFPYGSASRVATLFFTEDTRLRGEIFKICPLLVILVFLLEVAVFAFFGAILVFLLK